MDSFPSVPSVCTALARSQQQREFHDFHVLCASSRRYARLFALVYTVLLHFMVFTLLSRASHHHATAEQLCLRQHHMVHEMDAATHHISDPIATATQHTAAVDLSKTAGGTAGGAVGAMAAGLVQSAADKVAALSPWAAAAAPR